MVVRYKEVRRTLAAEIVSGRYAIGDKFPTDLELCERFGVSRHTVREALRDLQTKGILQRRRGSGTVVCGRSGPTLLAQEFGTFGKLFAGAGETFFERRYEGRIVVRERLAELLGCKAGEAWLRFAGIRWHRAKNIKVGWTEIFVPEPYFGVRELVTPMTDTVYQLIEDKFGVTLHRLEQEISAISINPISAAELDTTPNGPGLSVLRRYFDSSNELFEVAVSMYPANLFTFKSEILRSDNPLDDENT
jgi:GntR family transcriptional regulator